MTHCSWVMKATARSVRRLARAIAATGRMLTGLGRGQQRMARTTTIETSPTNPT
jgi:hypothetical protein